MIIIVHGKDFFPNRKKWFILFILRTNSCVSYGNYKFFILFLAWAFIFCAYVAATSLEYFIQFWQVKEILFSNYLLNFYG
jgi:hypothetical protein